MKQIPKCFLTYKPKISLISLRSFSTSEKLLKVNNYDNNIRKLSRDGVVEAIRAEAAMEDPVPLPLPHEFPEDPVRTREEHATTDYNYTNDEYGLTRRAARVESLADSGPENLSDLDLVADFIRNDIQDIRNNHPDFQNLPDRERCIANAEQELADFDHRIEQLRNQEHDTNDNNNNNNDNNNNHPLAINPNNNNNNSGAGGSSNNGGGSGGINNNNNSDSNDGNANFFSNFSFSDMYLYDWIINLPGYTKYVFIAFSVYKIMKNHAMYFNIGIWLITLYKAVSNIPKIFLTNTYLLKSELLSSYNNTINPLSIFNFRLEKAEPQKVKFYMNNFAGKPKHYPPANKEWFNSIYAYNTNTVKLLPAADKNVLKLIKSYFNLYSRKLEKNIRSRRLRVRAKRLSTNRILVSRPEIKHTSEKVIITLYVYNRQKKYYLNKINRMATIYKIDELLPKKVKMAMIGNDSSWPSKMIISLIKEKSSIVKSKINKQVKVLFNSFNIINKTNNKFISYEMNYLKPYVVKVLRKEMFSILFGRLISFNKSKFDEGYLLPITNIVERFYNKKAEFNFVNLKYLYLNSYIFSETLVTKLKNRKNKLLRVLKTSLLMFKLPSMNRSAVYDEIYNRKRRLQNIKVDSIVGKLSSLKVKDSLDLLLSKVNEKSVVSSFKHFSYPLHLTNTIINGIRNKYVSGIRLEAAGRLTKRNTAARSLFKLRYKGNIKNVDSSYKGLSTVLLRGHARPNLQYTKLQSKIRIGSFGLKGWVNSS